MELVIGPVVEFSAVVFLSVVFHVPEETGGCIWREWRWVLVCVSVKVVPGCGCVSRVQCCMYLCHWRSSF